MGMPKRRVYTVHLNDFLRQIVLQSEAISPHEALGCKWLMPDSGKLNALEGSGGAYEKRKIYWCLG